jgi:hypothetical protein
MTESEVVDRIMHFKNGHDSGVFVWPDILVATINIALRCDYNKDALVQIYNVLGHSLFDEVYLSCSPLYINYLPRFSCGGAEELYRTAKAFYDAVNANSEWLAHNVKDFSAAAQRMKNSVGKNKS